MFHPGVALSRLTIRLTLGLRIRIGSTVVARLNLRLDATSTLAHPLYETRDKR